MPLHIDQYEAILGYMPDCGTISTNTERIDWFIPTVLEDIYASAKAMSLTQKIQGALEWGNMVLLFLCPLSSFSDSGTTEGKKHT